MSQMDDLVSKGCDVHVHIIGNQSDYPMLDMRRYTPGLASVAALEQHLAGQGLERAVIIQPSIYGFDNRCTLDAVRAMQGRARAVLVLPTSVTASELQSYEAQGARGVRLNIERAEKVGTDDVMAQIKHWGNCLAPLGWHIQMYAPIGLISACADVITKLPVPVVFDHFALWTDATCSSDDARAVLKLFESGKIYIKLSASYRQPIQCPQELTSLAHRLLFLRSDRLLWGSDWPHTNQEPGKKSTELSQFKNISATSMLEERHDWLGNAQWREQVLVDNPSLLYRF